MLISPRPFHKAAKLTALMTLALAMPVATAPAESAPQVDPAADASAKQPVAIPAFADLAALGVFEKVYYQSTDDGSIYAKGSNYKAKFTGAGLTYRPQGGEPITFALTSATVGNQPLAFNTDALPTRDGDTISIDRGSFVEHYNLTHNSVEQLFTFDQLPAHGDLVLRIATSAPNMIATTNESGLAFRSEAGDVSYSRAVLVDADGVAAGLSTQLVNGVIEIRVSGSALNRAAFPITIDPIINFNVPLGGTLYRNPDVAYEATTNRFIIVAEFEAGPLDGDVYSILTNADGTPIADTFDYVDLTFDNWRKPKVANHNAMNCFVVVAEAGVAPTRGIWGGIVIALTGDTIGHFELVTGSSGGEKTNPDIGGNVNLASPTELLVVWEWAYMPDVHYIIGHRFSHTLEPAGDYIFIGTTLTYNSKPAVSNSNMGGDWMVVWQRTYTEADEDIYAARVGSNGLITFSQFALNASFANHTSPRVSTAMNGQYLVTYEQSGKIVVQLLNSNMNTAHLTTLEALGDNPMNQPRWLPTVDANGEKFIVGYSEVFAGNNADWDIYADTLCVTSNNTLKLGEFHKNVAYSGTRDLNAAIATCWSAGGNASHSALFGFTHNMSASSQAGQVATVVYNASNSCCPEDVAPLGGDNVINVSDLLAVINQWQNVGSCISCTADVNSDTYVNVTDLLRIINAWGVCQ